MSLNKKIAKKFAEITDLVGEDDDKQEALLASLEAQQLLLSTFADGAEDDEEDEDDTNADIDDDDDEEEEEEEEDDDDDDTESSDDDEEDDEEEDDEEEEDLIPSDSVLKKMSLKEIVKLAKSHEVTISGRIKEPKKQHVAYIQGLKEEREEQKEIAKLEKLSVNKLIDLAKKKKCLKSIQKKVDKFIDNDEKDEAKELLVETIWENS